MRAPRGSLWLFDRSRRTDALLSRRIDARPSLRGFQDLSGDTVGLPQKA